MLKTKKVTILRYSMYTIYLDMNVGCYILVRYHQFDYFVDYHLLKPNDEAAVGSFQ